MSLLIGTLVGALMAAHEHHLRVPDDIAIVGFDDMPFSEVLNPPLTVVAQNTVEIGNRAAALLLERIEQPTLPSRTAVLETTLVIRESCGARRSSARPLE